MSYTSLYIKRGLKANLPVLNIGEPAFCTDTKELYIGSSEGNILINREGVMMNVINNLESQSISDALSALQGYVLNNMKADKDSPTFTGTPMAPTPTSTTNNTQIATTAFVYGKTGEFQGILETIQSDVDLLKTYTNATPIIGNRFTISLDSITDLDIVGGVWDESLMRLKC